MAVFYSVTDDTEMILRAPELENRVGHAIHPSHSYPAWTRLLPLVLKGVFFPPLAQLYKLLYRKNGDLQYLHTSIQYALASLATTPVNHPSLPHYQQRLADSLCDRYGRLRHERDLHLAIMLQASALAATPSTHADITWHRRSLHFTYQLRYRHTGNLKYLDESISLNLMAVPDLVEGSPDLASCQESLANSYLLRYFRLARPEDLEAELKWALAAVDSTAAEDSLLPSRLTILGSAYSDRCVQYHTIDDIDLGLFWLHSAISKTPTKQVNYFTRQQTLATLYSERYNILGNVEDLQKAIKLCQENFDGIPSGHPSLVQCHHNLAFYSWLRYLKLDTYKDLEVAIDHALQSVKGSVITDPDFGLFSGQCAILFLRKYQIQGNLDDLEAAAKWNEAAILALSDRYAKADRYQHNYAIVHHCRHKRHRDRKDLDLAFQWCNSAITLTRRDDPDLQQRQHLLAVLYQDLFKLSGDHKHLDLALEIQCKVVSKTSNGHPDAAERFSTLAVIYYLIYYKGKGGVENRDAVMKWNHAAVDAASSDDPQLYLYKNALGLQYLNRYHRLRDPMDLEYSLKMGEEALALIPSDHPAITRHWQVVAEAYAEKYNLAREIQDRERAVQYFQKASSALNGDPSALWKVADRWARFAELENLPECLDAYKAAYRILPDLFWLGSRVSSRHETLIKHDVASTTTNAIAACMKFNDLELAVEFLEQSLSLTFQQLLDLQTDLSVLEKKFPQYASKLQEISAELQTIAISTEDDADLSAIPGQTTLRDKQRKLAIERGALLKTIREIPEFENFLLPVPFKSLLPAAQYGSVIIINCSVDRCDALILKPGGNPVHILLPGVTSKVVSHQCEKLRFALRHYGIHSREIDTDRAARTALFKKSDGETVLGEVLAWIWIFIVSPIFQALEANDIVDGRIWWCLTGSLTYLPLHAAGPQSSYVQSYTSTLSALIRARSSPAPKNPAKVVAVGLSEVGTGSRSSLPNVKLEIEALKVAIGEQRMSTLFNEEATLEKVTGLLPQSSWLHLACHGQQGDAQDPLKSGLLLYGDKKLGLEKLINTPIPGAEFVFLSACETAMGDTDMRNESLHLAGGMIFAGFKAAIGTLWAISDIDGPVVAKAVYSHLFNDGKEPDVTSTAEALHLAVRALREKGVPPHRWVPFIHIGI